MGRIRIQVATLADVGDDEARTDGVSGLLVTLTSIDTAASHLIELVSSTETPVPSLVQLSSTVWTFTPNAGPQTYILQCTTVDSAGVSDVRRRVYAIRTPTLGLPYPGLNEKASDTASLLNNGASVVSASNNNENGNYWGWGPTLNNWLAAVEQLRADVDAIVAPSGGSLDDAYNSDRIITVDAGAVSLQANTSSQAPLIEVVNAGVGDAATGFTRGAQSYIAGIDGSDDVYKVRPGTVLGGDGLDVRSDGTVASSAAMSVGTDLDVNGAISNGGMLIDDLEVGLGSAALNQPLHWYGTGEWDIGGVGTAGQILKSNGSGAAPSWQDRTLTLPVLSSGAASVSVTAEQVVLCTGASAQTVTLPAGSEGQLVIVKDKTGAASSHPITIVPTGVETIDGETSATLSSNYESLGFIFSGTEWSII